MAILERTFWVKMHFLIANRHFFWEYRYQKNIDKAVKCFFFFFHFASMEGLPGDQWMCTARQDKAEAIFKFEQFGHLHLFLNPRHIFPETLLTGISDQCEDVSYDQLKHLYLIHTYIIHIFDYVYVWLTQFACAMSYFQPEKALGEEKLHRGGVIHCAVCVKCSVQCVMWRGKSRELTCVQLVCSLCGDCVLPVCRLCVACAACV